MFLSSPPTASITILDNLDQPPGPLLYNDIQFFAYKRSAEHPEPRTHSCIDFTIFLLNLLGYEGGHRLLGLWAKEPFLMAGRRIIANIDLFLMKLDELRINEYILIVHEHKHSNQNPQATVIAKAIVALEHNNCKRVKAGLQRLPDKEIYAIVMKRTAPIFYRVHVTTALVDALATSAYPQEETLVLRFIPPVPNQQLYSAEGMHPLANRRSVSQCLEGSCTRYVNHNRRKGIFIGRLPVLFIVR
ncbi:hypothetical protein K443DRAFT_672922 [Laccaria amethystina LaAM-08-1]|uniref:Uncharacterized protein n=1 Tax=Laccaria amethystina LaAM-08-1 TaxID=1095629 RepID=A0A0C9Y2I7_9AGAR|nr:hypothetical protein K443DRAFT_672922 [Laccaria amethystina LaAM-08-1]